MTGKQKQRTILFKIIQAAQEYKLYLLGHTFMFVFDDNRYVEISFRKVDFAHLTGVGRSISALDFYRNAVRKILKNEQFYFSERFPYHLSERKLNILLNLSEIFTNDGFILEDVVTNTFIYKIGFTDLKLTMCFGEDSDSQDNKKSDYLIIRSLRANDCFDKAQQVHEIDYILKKKNTDKLYNEILLNNKSGHFADNIKLKIVEPLRKINA